MIEEWREIEGYEGYYEVSNLGKVRSLDRKVFNPKSGMAIRRGCLLQPNTNHKGYKYVGFHKNGVRSGLLFVHKLVARAFILNPENKPQVNHKDGDKLNNAVWNLEWNTDAENQKHAKDNFLKSRNENHKDSVLTNEQVLFLPRLFEIGMNQGMIAKIYGVDRHVIMNILKGVSYRQIVPEIKVITTGHVLSVIKMPIETYNRLCNLLKDNTVLNTLISKGKVSV